MTRRIPDLWRVKEDARRLYVFYLSRLQSYGMHDEVVGACRQIRQYASRGPGGKEGLFTFSFEIDSLCELGYFKVAWRQLRYREEIVFGKRLDLARRRWRPEDLHELEFSYAPVLYFLGRYPLGCSLLETSLRFWLHAKKVSSYDVLFRVYNGDEEPWNRCWVTLKHFYERLGKDLSEWPLWKKFVNGLHPRLFRLADVRREKLLEDPARMGVFFDNLMDLRRKRITSGMTRGQPDLIENPVKVKKWQQATTQKLAQFEDRILPTRERIEAKLQYWFPELQQPCK
jgi:hypothetical protein